MSLHDALLEQARHLAQREPRRPRQASLRRSVSAAYYALFHLLVRDASRLFVREKPWIAVLNRIYNHAEINRASKQFAGGRLPKMFDNVRPPVAVPLELQSVARAFVALQQARYEADYNLAKTFERAEVESLIDRAAQAFEDWRQVRQDDVARLYLGCFLLWDRWNKSR